MKVVARFVVLAVLVVGVFARVAHAEEEDYPSKAIRFVVPLPPGGLTDVLARVVAQKLTESWKQPVTVDNRGGGGTIIGTDIVAKAAPDGYTILLAPPALAINPSLRSDMPYDAEKSFAPVTLLVLSPAVLVVHPSLQVNTVRELIALAKSRPGELNYASGGNASGAHLAGELLKRRAGINMVHVPYKGQGMVLPAVLSGQVPVTIIQMPTVRALLAQGKLRALAVVSGERSKAMPDLPTIAEAAGLPEFNVNTWFGVVAPAGTPIRIVSRLNSEIGKIMRMPDVRDMLVPRGAEPATGTPEEFAAFIRGEIATAAELVKIAGARVD